MLEIKVGDHGHKETTSLSPLGNMERISMRLVYDGNEWMKTRDHSPIFRATMMEETRSMHGGEVPW